MAISSDPPSGARSNSEGHLITTEGGIANFFRILIRLSSWISERGPSSRKLERRCLRGAIGTASLSASEISPQTEVEDEKGSAERRRGLVRPPTNEDEKAGLEKGNIHIVRYSGRSSKVARPGRKGKEDLRKKGIRREKRNFVKRNKGQRCSFQDIGSQESPEEIFETPDSVLHGRFKEPEETLPRLGPLQRNRLSLGSEEEIPAYEESKRRAPGTLSCPMDTC
ncbi:hypothetical protein F2Q70_00005556 [Brassica cretica]|uniref:Uncharacterized protein n=1 Tax=Brassica cretica TaxID=69181 RepID=A0A8S9IUT3_BRACR|nr:hypothetical protein F2Q70_00005556 [Brassica cretica]